MMNLKLMTTLLLLYFLCNNIPATAQGRISQTINTGWLFAKGNRMNTPADTTGWQPVSVPHSWNAEDVMDDVPGYYRGFGTYKKTIYVPTAYSQKDVYLHFEGAAQVAAVFVNGKLSGRHTGSYAAFNCPITALLQYDGKANANEVVVLLDNSHSENIPPLSADFTFFGGLYRDVHLVALDKVHFDCDNYASDGIFITTPVVTEEKASVQVKGSISNRNNTAAAYTIKTQIEDRSGNIIATESQKLKLNAGSNTGFVQQIRNISRPHLWSPEDPYLYQVITTITDAKGNIIDELSNPLGFRWFEFTAEKGFFLNGKHCKLWGASRHQDNIFKANALEDALHVKDIQLLKDMGANLLRVAHYPQDPAVLEACDRLGIIASVEIPVVNAITENDTFRNNCLEMQKEMIRQHFNHPSVMIWAYMNEVLLRLRYSDDKPRQEVYFKHVKELAMELDSLTRAEDPSRYTMIPFHGDQSLYIKTGLAAVPQIVGWNQYSGWYGSDINQFAVNMDRHRKELPNKPMIVTEYGADGDPRLRGFNGERFDKTIEYETEFHKVYFDVMDKRPFVAGGMVWNLADFNAEARYESMPHINNKGLLTIERQPKDAYLLYQSKLMSKPYIAISSRSWTLRSGIADAADVYACTQPVEVFVNRDEQVSLYLNGTLLKDQKPENGIAQFSVPFKEGINQLEAVLKSGDTMVKDRADIKFLLQPYQLKDTVVPFRELNISLGDKRLFNDDNLQQVWLPEQPYSEGSWGYIGGEVFKLNNSRRQPYGSDKNIFGTDYDPIYETQRTGLQQFRLDVSDGRYEVTLLFAELLSSALRDANIYNLDNGHNKPVPEQPEERDFDVLFNGKLMLEHISSDNYLVPEQAYNTKVFVNVTNGKGIVIDFKAHKGSTILNGLQVRKIY